MGAPDFFINLRGGGGGGGGGPKKFENHCTRASLSFIQTGWKI